MFTGRPGTREVLVRYALAIARTGLVHRVLASRRWSGGDKADALALLGMLFSVTLFPALVACVLWWLLLGRGPVRWAGTARCVVVNPFRQPGRRGRLPADVEEGIRTATERWQALAKAADDSTQQAGED